MWLLFNTFRDGRATSGGSFGSGEGRIWLDEVGCDGTENSINDCEKDPWGRNDCTHSEDAGVYCFSHTLPMLNNSGNIVV